MDDRGPRQTSHSGGEASGGRQNESSTFGGEVGDSSGGSKGYLLMILKSRGNSGTFAKNGNLTSLKCWIFLMIKISN